MNRHPRIVSRHLRWNLNLASPRNLRLGVLVLLLITLNRINEPLVELTYGEAFLYWGVRPLVLACGLWLADWLITKYLAGHLTRQEWVKPVVLVSTIGLIPLALTESVLELHLPFPPDVVDHELWAFSPVLAVLGELATLASIVIPFHLLLWLIIDRKAYTSGDSGEATRPLTPEFLRRTSNLQAEDVLALQAEEHYVRIYTSDSTELVQCRFGDAVEEMPRELGLQVHRSWWVAEGAVRSAQRGARRWQLDLESGVTVPVSDSYVVDVRERGWLKRRPRK